MICMLIGSNKKYSYSFDRMDYDHSRLDLMDDIGSDRPIFALVGLNGYFHFC